MKRTNFIIQDLGTITAIIAKSQKAVNYLNRKLHTDSWQWEGNILYIDSRYFEDISIIFK